MEAAVVKSQWLMFVALNDSLGIGEKRIYRMFQRYMELINEYKGLKRDEVADEMLFKRVNQITKVKELYEGDANWVKRNAKNHGNG